VQDVGDDRVVNPLALDDVHERRPKMAVVAPKTPADDFDVYPSLREIR
jgi:hypothetical protein